jgi:hypothetical protein
MFCHCDVLSCADLGVGELVESDISIRRSNFSSFKRCAPVLHHAGYNTHPPVVYSSFDTCQHVAFLHIGWIIIHSSWVVEWLKRRHLTLMCVRVHGQDEILAARSYLWPIRMSQKMNQHVQHKRQRPLHITCTRHRRGALYN